MDLFNKFTNVTLLVIGDIMLDRYLSGDVNRISPEAPVPVVRLKRTTYTAGGAANVAANVVGLGAKCFLLGIVGDDEEGKILPQVLAAQKVAADHLVQIRNRQTTVKTRVLAHNQQIVRLDQETNAPLLSEEEETVWKKALGLIKEADAVVVSDYNKGLLGANFLSRLITSCKEFDKKILIDPKGRDYSKYRGATLLTPNKFELSDVSGGLDSLDGDSLSASARQLVEKLDLEALLVTRGEEGMTLIERGSASAVHLSTAARDVYDVTGAGDTVIATLATAIAAGESYGLAAAVANEAAGLVVSELGTTAVKLESLRNVFNAESSSDTVNHQKAALREN